MRGGFLSGRRSQTHRDAGAVMLFAHPSLRRVEQAIQPYSTEKAPPLRRRDNKCDNKCDNVDLPRMLSYYDSSSCLPRFFSIFVSFASFSENSPVSLEPGPPLLCAPTPSHSAGLLRELHVGNISSANLALPSGCSKCRRHRSRSAATSATCAQSVRQQ